MVLPIIYIYNIYFINQFLKHFLKTNTNLRKPSFSGSAMWLTVSLLAITAGLLYWQYWKWTHKRLLELAALVPGPPALPILGNALIFMVNPGGKNY